MVNLFTRSAYAPFSKATGEEAVTSLRCAEDEAVAALLGDAIRWYDASLLDAPLRLRIEAARVLDADVAGPTFAAQVASVKLALSELLDLQKIRQIDGVFVPAAIGGHLDHRVVRAAAEELFSPQTIAYYEDLPYAARQPQTGPRECWQDEKHSPLLLKESDSRRIKWAMCSLYPSQIERATVYEIAGHTGERGGECFHAGEQIRTALQALLPGAR